MEHAEGSLRWPGHDVSWCRYFFFMRRRRTSIVGLGVLRVDLEHGGEVTERLSRALHALVQPTAVEQRARALRVLLQDDVELGDGERDRLLRAGERPSMRRRRRTRGSSARQPAPSARAPRPGGFVALERGLRHPEVRHRLHQAVGSPSRIRAGGEGLAHRDLPERSPTAAPAKARPHRHSAGARRNRDRLHHLRRRHPRGMPRHRASPRDRRRGRAGCRRGAHGTDGRGRRGGAGSPAPRRDGDPARGGAGRWLARGDGHLEI